MQRQRAGTVRADEFVKRFVGELDDHVQLLIVGACNRAFVAVRQLVAASRRGTGGTRRGRLRLQHVRQTRNRLLRLVEILLHGLRLVLGTGNLVLERRDLGLEVVNLRLRLLQLIFDGGFLGRQRLNLLALLLDLDLVQADLLRQLVVIGHELLKLRADVRELLARLAELSVLLARAAGDEVDQLLGRARPLDDELAGVRLVGDLVLLGVQGIQAAQLAGLLVAPLHERETRLLELGMIILKKILRVRIIHLARLAGGHVLLRLKTRRRRRVLGLDEGRQRHDAVPQLLVAILQQLFLLKEFHLEIQRDAGDSQNHVDERVYSLVHIVSTFFSDRLGDGANLVRAITV